MRPNRGTQEWREAHRGKVSASDIPALLSSKHSQRYQQLLERLVLDESGPNHTDEYPEPWQEKHERDLKIALASYSKEVGREYVSPGLFQCASIPVLVASPHAFTDQLGNQI